MSWLIKMGIAYLLSAGVCYALIHYEVQPHKNGCGLCKRYGEFCGCGYSFLNMRVHLERLKKWLEQTSILDEIESIAFVGKVFSGTILSVLILVVPALAFVAVTVTHILNPWHRKKCLSDLLNPPKEVETV